MQTTFLSFSSKDLKVNPSLVFSLFLQMAKQAIHCHLILQLKKEKKGTESFLNYNPELIFTLIQFILFCNCSGFPATSAVPQCAEEWQSQADI